MLVGMITVSFRAVRERATHLLARTDVARDYLVRIADPAALVVISVELGLCIAQEYVLFLR